MSEIVKITISSTSGYGPVEYGYKDKVTITRDSIRYEYKPLAVTEISAPQKWSYYTTSQTFQDLFAAVCEETEKILNRNIFEFEFLTDIGTTAFSVVYADKSIRKQKYEVSSDEFKECFSLIKMMVPGCEIIPAVLTTSDDYDDASEEEDEETEGEDDYEEERY